MDRAERRSRSVELARVAAEGLADLGEVTSGLVKRRVISRRRLMTGSAVLGATAFQGTRGAAAAPEPAAPSPAPTPAPAPATIRTWQHAVGNPRGSDIAVAVGRSSEGRFGVMFKDAPSFQPPDEALHDLAVGMVDPRPLGREPSDGDAGDNPDITAGYTFLGQFIDHDMTRDTTPLGLQQSDPWALTNFDTPWLDLQSVYGGGPTSDPQLYEADGVRLKIAFPQGIADLPRSGDGSAFLGDPRNDENLVIAQLHVAFLAFHNRLVSEGRSFADAQRLTRWHFQWLVVNEFLPRIAGAAVMASYLSVPVTSVRPRFYRPKNPTKPFMPIEYAVGAYRFGHSMVRPEYEMNDAHTRAFFGAEGSDLRGSRVIPSELQADWSYFFDVPGMSRPDGLNFARLIDSNISLPLHDLPPTVVPRDITPAFVDLAERNLLRGKRLGLPSGQDTATAMGIRPLTNAELGITDPRFDGRAPLWFYVLKEAELRHAGRHLGEVGARIVAETILAFLVYDRGSYFWAKPGFTPMVRPFTVGHLLRRSGTGKNMPQP